MKDKILKLLNDSINTKSKLISDDNFLINVEQAVDNCIETITKGNTIFFCGNGGSAADAQHISAELTGKFKNDRKPLSAIVLGSNFSSLTAISNDYNFEDVFARELNGLGKEGDLLIAYTTSGKSKNVIKALETSKQLNINTIVMVGKDSDEVSPFADVVISIPSDITARIQESHITVSHIIFEIFEEKLFDA
tara:strand:- start:8094 stop:8672 length:579 start_codon:yes stop_codon:yes gene_type:complete